MSASAYKCGKRAACNAIGVKLAEVEAGDVAQGAAVGAAGLAPFAGLIGQKPIIHDPWLGAEGARYKSMQELARQARPGDILVTSTPKGSMWKHVIAPTSGSEFYHVQPVVGAREGMGTTISANELASESLQKYSPRKLYEYADPIPAAMKEHKYQDVILLRPKDMSKKERRAVSRAALERAKRPYSGPKSVSTWLRDIFVPKIPGITDIGKKTVCEGNVCSTLPAMARHEGTGGAAPSVVPGKRPQDIFPADYLRSTEHEMIGSYTGRPGGAPTRSLMRRAAPWLVRGGLGAGLAGATYAATEEPAIAGAPVGALAADVAARKVLARTPQYAGLEGSDKLIRDMPSLMSYTEAMLDPTRKHKLSRTGRFLGRSLPVLLAGGMLGYGAGALAEKAMT